MEMINFKTQGTGSFKKLNCGICGKLFYRRKSELIRRKIKNPSCSIKCCNIIKQKTMLGRKNPNCIYNKVQDDYFKKIDSEFKAYFLGWIASDGHISKNNDITIKIHKRDIEILDLINKETGWGIKIKYTENDTVRYRIQSKQMNNDLCSLLHIKCGKKSNVVCFPKIKQKYHRHFIRGLMDGDGSINKIGKQASISMNSPFMIEDIYKYSKFKPKLEIKISGIYNSYMAYWSKKEYFPYLDWIYKNATFFLKRKYKTYLKHKHRGIYAS